MRVTKGVVCEKFSKLLENFFGYITTKIDVVETKTIQSLRLSLHGLYCTQYALSFRQTFAKKEFRRSLYYEREQILSSFCTRWRTEKVRKFRFFIFLQSRNSKNENARV